MGTASQFEDKFMRPVLAVSVPYSDPEFSYFDRYHIIYVNTLKNKRIFRGLSWLIVFKGVNMVQYLLFEKLLSQRWHNLDDSEKMVYVIICQLALKSRTTFKEWTHTTKPIFRQLKKIKPRERKDPNCNNLLHIALQGNLIKKDQDRNLQFKLQLNEFRQRAKPRPKRFVGKGNSDVGKNKIIQQVIIADTCSVWEPPPLSFDEEFQTILGRIYQKFSLRKLDNHEDLIAGR